MYSYHGMHSYRPYNVPPYMARGRETVSAGLVTSSSSQSAMADQPDPGVDPDGRLLQAIGSSSRSPPAADGARDGTGSADENRSALHAACVSTCLPEDHKQARRILANGGSLPTCGCGAASSGGSPPSGSSPPAWEWPSATRWPEAQPFQALCQMSSQGQCSMGAGNPAAGGSPPAGGRWDWPSAWEWPSGSPGQRQAARRSPSTENAARTQNHRVSIAESMSHGLFEARSEAAYYQGNLAMAQRRLRRVLPELERLRNVAARKPEVVETLQLTRALAESRERCDDLHGQLVRCAWAWAWTCACSSQQAGRAILALPVSVISRQHCTQASRGMTVACMTHGTAATRVPPLRALHSTHDSLTLATRSQVRATDELTAERERSTAERLQDAARKEASTALIVKHMVTLRRAYDMCI